VLTNENLKKINLRFLLSVGLRPFQSKNYNKNIEKTSNSEEKSIDNDVNQNKENCNSINNSRNNTNINFNNQNKENSNNC
jgi:hypothetical protein